MVKELAIIDPCINVAEFDSFNLLVRLANRPCTYHLPAMYGLKSLFNPSCFDKYAGIIILGSNASPKDNLHWQNALREWLTPYIHRKIPILGICYGHQLLASMFGAQMGFVRGGEKLKELRKIEIKADPRLKLSLSAPNLVVSHRELVTTVPCDMEVWATSASLDIEGLRHKKMPIWSLQAHPEATLNFCEQKEILEINESILKDGWQILRAFIEYAFA